MTASNTAAVPDERAAFDAWADEKGLLPHARAARWNGWEARAALSQPAAAPLSGWMPIATAPKDGTVIMLYAPATTYEGKPVAERVTTGAWTEFVETASEYHATTGEYLGQSVQGGDALWMSWDGGFTEENSPTDWMPLPAAPGTEAAPVEQDAVREQLVAALEFMLERFGKREGNLFSQRLACEKACAALATAGAKP